jgi:hypothetical protein
VQTADRLATGCGTHLSLILNQLANTCRDQELPRRPNESSPARYMTARSRLAVSPGALDFWIRVRVWERKSTASKRAVCLSHQSHPD